VVAHSGVGQFLKLLVVSPHLEAFVRDQLESVLPLVGDAEVLLLRPRWANRDPQETSVIAEGRALAVPRRTFRSPLLATRTPVPLAAWSRAVSVVRRTLREGRFELVHAHFLYPSGAVAALAARAEHVPCVVTGHGFDVYALPFRSRRWRRAVVGPLHDCAAVMTVSERNASLLRQLGVRARTIHVIPNGYDPTLFRPGPRREARERLGIEDAAPVVLSVGHLVQVKGFDLALHALARLPWAVRFVLVGRGPERARLVRLARDLGMADRVSFAGEVSHAAVADYIRAADIVLISSRSEGNPTILFEALGCGRPVVATSVGGIPEILDAGSGVLVPPGDAAAIARALDRALKNDWSSGTIAARATQWTWPRLSRDLAQLYHEAVATGGRV